VLVAKRAEKIFPKRRFPAGIFGAGQQRAGFVLKTHFRGGVQEFRELRLGKLAQRRGTLAAQIFRQAGFIFQRQRQFRQRRIEKILQRQLHGATLIFRFWTLGGLPEDMQNDAFEIGILVMAVRVPAA